jgi:hypothetical protein
MKRIATAIGIVGIATIIGILAGCTPPHSHSVSGLTGHSVSAPSSSPAAAPAPSPTLVPPNRVRFVITGSVAASEFGGVDINYGSDADTHDRTLPSLNGRVTYTVPFDPSAQYYSVDVDWSSAGSVTCKIVVLGPAPDAPLTVSRGSGDGGNNGAICSAQAAPNDSTGMSWQNEG